MHREEVISDMDGSLCGVIISFIIVGDAVGEVKTLKAFLINFCWLKMFRAQAAACSYSFPSCPFVWHYLQTQVYRLLLLILCIQHCSWLKSLILACICLWLTGQSAVVPCVNEIGLNLTYYSLIIHSFEGFEAIVFGHNTFLIWWHSQRQKSPRVTRGIQFSHFRSVSPIFGEIFH